MAEAVVIFEGSKFFWRTRNTIDVTIIEHGDSEVTEVICYEPSIDMEASRVYLDSTVLDKRVDHAQVEENLSFAKRNNVPLTEKFVRNNTNQATADYILNRLFLTDFTVFPKKFEITFQLNFRDVVIEAVDTNVERLIRGPPAHLVPFTVRHNKIFSEYQKDQAMKALEDATQNLQEHCLTAMALQAQPVLPLGVKERWRIPIVLGKLAHDRVLSDKDSKIWDTVASKLKTQEDIDRITRVTLRTVEPEPEPEPVVAPTPAAKKIFGFGQFHQPVVKRASTSPPSASPIPVTTPGPPPRSPHTPHSYSSSRHLMADTTNSHRRATNSAEDNADKKKGTGTKKKSPSRRTAPRPRGRGASAEASADNSESAISSDAETPTLVPTAFSAPHEATSFMSQVVAALTLALPSERNKVHSMPTETDSPKAHTLFSQQGSVKYKCKPQDSAEISMERRHLGAMNPRLLATSSTASSLQTEFAFLNCSEHLSPILQTQFIVTEVSDKKSMYGEPSVTPTHKRRSNLGSFLATFTSAVDACGFDSTAELSKKEYPNHRAGMMSFKWLLGSHSQKVVPADQVHCH